MPYANYSGIQFFRYKVKFGVRKLLRVTLHPKSPGYTWKIIVFHGCTLLLQLVLSQIFETKVLDKLTLSQRSFFCVCFIKSFVKRLFCSLAFMPVICVQITGSFQRATQISILVISSRRTLKEEFMTLRLKLKTLKRLSS